jgi:hypothetical protein
MFRFTRLKTQSSELKQGKTAARADANNNLSPSPLFQFEVTRALMHKMTRRNSCLQTVCVTLVTRTQWLDKWKRSLFCSGETIHKNCTIQCHKKEVTRQWHENMKSASECVSQEQGQTRSGMMGRKPLPNKGSQTLKFATKGAWIQKVCTEMGSDIQQYCGYGSDSNGQKGRLNITNESKCYLRAVCISQR